MARVTIVCCLFAVLALVCWKVQGGDVCREYDLGAFAAMLGKFQMELSSFKEKIEAQRKENGDMREKLASQNKKIEALEKKTEAVGFTVCDIDEVSSSEVMLFSKVRTNSGNGYNKTTGIFTCRIPGFYFFSVSLLKRFDYDGNTYCRIYKNSEHLVSAYSKPGPSPHTGVTATVSNVYTHLDAGDTVNLGGCTKTASWNTGYFSPFSGFLVTPDPA